MLEIAFHPDRISPQPLARQLADHLAGLIVSGHVPAGSRLPASRELALGLAVARKTATGAYTMLVQRGLVQARVGQGTFVAATATSAVARRASSPPARPFAWAGLFARSEVGSFLARFGDDPLHEYPYDFRAGRVDPSALPVTDLRWAFARPFENRSRLRAVAAHQDPFGWLPLRREVARYLVARGVRCAAEDVAIVNGLQQAIDLTARVLLDPGDAAVVEQPGYFGAPLAIAARGAECLRLEVDGEGLDTAQLARVLRLRRVKLIYVTPATQCPTGATLSPSRRAALLALADQYQVPVFEDDYDAELRYSGPVVAALKAADAAGQVIYAGTFSKVLFPGLRLGFVVAARPLLERMVAAHVAACFGTNVVVQAGMASLLAAGGLDRHVYMVRKRYGARLAVLLDSLARTMPPTARWSTPRSGHVVWLTLPPGVDADRLRQAARALGVSYTRGEVFFDGANGSNHLALAFTAIEPAAIKAGIERLGGAINELIPTVSPRRRFAVRGSRVSMEPSARKERRNVSR